MHYVLRRNHPVVGWVYWTGKIAMGEYPSYSIRLNDAVKLTMAQAMEDRKYIRQSGWEIWDSRLV